MHRERKHPCIVDVPHIDSTTIDHWPFNDQATDNRPQDNRPLTEQFAEQVISIWHDGFYKC